MIRTETIIINGKEFIRTYSDAGFMVHGGSPEADYIEAIDPIEFNRTYAETNIPIENNEEMGEEEEIVWQ